MLTVGRVDEEGLWVNFKAAGWIDPDDVVPAARAVDHFTGRVDRNASDAEAYLGRGRALAAHDRWDDASADLDQAVELAPQHPAGYLARAYVRTRQRRYDDALADYAEVIRLDPLEAQAYRLRAGVYVEMKNYRQAVDDYNLAARLFPNDAALNNDRAWLLATCPDVTYRNGEQAVKDASLACELSGWQVHNRLGTLAASYAEFGDFAQAVKWQQQCVALSPRRFQPAQRARLQLYESGKPYREYPGVWK
jgi:tetratricopeptide (TPR) repeat protein